MNIFDILSKKLSSKVSKSGSQYATNTFDCNCDSLENRFLSKMSNNALNLYEKQCEIKNLTKLVLSNPENTSHNDLVAELLKDNILDPLEDDVIKNLAENKELLDDLDL